MPDDKDKSRSSWMSPVGPFWWPDSAGFMIAAMLAICAFTVIYRMRYPSEVNDKILDMMITILFSTCLVLIYNYRFGSSSGKESQDKALSKIAMEPVAPIAPVAVVAPIAPIAPIAPASPMTVDTVNVTSETTNVTQEKDK
jgi:hypothetical protein